MIRALRPFVALLLLSVATGGVHGITITDTNSYGLNTSGQIIANGASFNDTWSLLAHGYTPGTHTITSAYASFTLLDNNRSNFYSIALDTSALVSGSNFTGTFNWGHSIIGISLGTLTSTGVLSYTITNTSAASALASGPQFRLASATLTAQVEQLAAVPEHGGTAALLGVGLLAVGALRHRRFSRSAC